MPRQQSLSALLPLSRFLPRFRNEWPETYFSPHVWSKAELKSKIGKVSTPDEATNKYRYTAILRYVASPSRNSTLDGSSITSTSTFTVARFATCRAFTLFLSPRPPPCLLSFSEHVGWKPENAVTELCDVMCIDAKV